MYLNVAVPGPLRRTFQYLPRTRESVDLRGFRVRVPFGRQTKVGIVTGTSDTPGIEASRLRPIHAVLDDEPVIDPSLLALCQWAADYYHHSPGDVLQTAIPVLLRQGHSANRVPPQALALTTTGETTALSGLERAPRQKALVSKLQQDKILHKSTLDELAFDRRVIAEVISKGLAQWQDVEQPHADGIINHAPEYALTTEQQDALNQLDDPRPKLLFGVTGSGKTEVYFQAIEQCLANNQQALMLVPEIGLTPQLIDRIKQRFCVSMGVLHSNLTDHERLRAWQEARDKLTRIVIGTRSALFTPLPELGLIVVDEEHDASYKQHEGFRYSARDLAVKRGDLQSARVILGSATPSLETLQNCHSNKYQLLTLTSRTGQPERYQLVDTRQETHIDGIATPSLQAIRKTLQAGNQVLVFINRRGFSPVMFCPDCNTSIPCHRCDARLTYHKARRRLVCHHCGHERAPPSKCESCGGSSLLEVGSGTQRVEETLEGQFPGYPVIRVDRDSTRRRDTMETMISEIQTGKPAILVGTQMLAKGHHFPHVTLVLMLDMDAGFYSADFKSLERTGQLVKQVGGRSGRADKPGLVVIQTQLGRMPETKLLIDEGYAEFARHLLRQREQYALPPFSYQCLIRAESVTRNAAFEFLDAIASPAPSVEVLGPVAPVMEKRAGRYRAQLLLTSASRGALHQAIADKVGQAEASKLASRVRWSVDVDPVDLT